MSMRNESAGQGKRTHYLLPLKWSLHYFMTKKEWADFRNMMKQIIDQWNRCRCPRRCIANTLDEQWEYDHTSHMKCFVSATFICSGCHWLKTFPWRVQTWLQMDRGELPAMTKPPHISWCLGWTDEQIADLRQQDLPRHHQEMEELLRVEADVAAGLAEVRYWSVDLSAMKEYGYSEVDIAEFERRMNNLERKRSS